MAYKTLLDAFGTQCVVRQTSSPFGAAVQHLSLVESCVCCMWRKLAEGWRREHMGVWELVGPNDVWRCLAQALTPLSSSPRHTAIIPIAAGSVSPDEHNTLHFVIADFIELYILYLSAE